ncbi:hypothetical protein [Streptomyces sp. NPDC055912]|uniref:hypothetical protein n=1 Tax=Streptomyces sp. NPDC055912 TaxID=3345660 RepID=UPI0035D6A555
MTPSSTEPRTVVHQILAEYREMAARHRIALNALSDVEGVMESEWDDYEETRRVQALEADEKLDGFIDRLTEAFGLPEDRPVAVLGANGAQFDVTPGQLDDTARDAFNNGQCHALARALAQETGWQTAAFIDPECDDDYENCGLGNHVADGVCICQIAHVVAVRPDGHLVDIDGTTDPQLVHDSPLYDLTPMTDAMWRMIESSPAWREADTAVARTFVQPLLATLNTAEVAA